MYLQASSKGLLNIFTKCNIQFWLRVPYIVCFMFEHAFCVHYRYGEPYKLNMACQNITTLSCDLTAETPYIYQNSYCAQVFANSHSLGHTALFKPLRDSKQFPLFIILLLDWDVFGVCVGSEGRILSCDTYRLLQLSVHIL